MCSDNNLYLNFVKASERLSSESFKKHKSKAEEGTLSGYEAKKFYDDILASTRSETDRCNNEIIKEENTQTYNRSRSRNRIRTRRHRSKESLNSSSSVSGPSSDGSKIPTENKSIFGGKGTNIRLVNIYLKAAQNGNLDEIEKVLKDNASFDVNVCDLYGWSALMCASFSGQIDVVRYLLRKGALWKGVLNSKGQTALDLAKLSKNKTIISLFESWDCTANESSVTRRIHSKKKGPFWCPVCQQECTEDQIKHQSSTVHQFNCQHKPKEVYYSIPGHNPGYQIMVKSGWDEEKGLGPEGEGRKYPIKTVLKRDRYGLGNDNASKARVTHFGPHDESAVKRKKVTEKTERKESQKNLSKKQKQRKESKEKEWERNMRLYMNI